MVINIIRNENIVNRSKNYENYIENRKDMIFLSRSIIKDNTTDNINECSYCNNHISENESQPINKITFNINYIMANNYSNKSTSTTHNEKNIKSMYSNNYNNPISFTSDKEKQSSYYKMNKDNKKYIKKSINDYG
jgi:hypothetical protein